jgi:hypothetical protein
MGTVFFSQSEDAIHIISLLLLTIQLTPPHFSLLLTIQLTPPHFSLLLTIQFTSPHFSLLLSHGNEYKHTISHSFLVIT